MRIRTLIAITLAMALGVGLATPAEVEAQPRPGAKDKREKAKQRIRIMRALILSEELQLDEATAGKLAPILNRFDDEIAKLLQERAALRAELRDAEGAGDDRRMDKAIDKLVANQDARWDTERRRFVDLRKLLSPRQTARLLDVLPEIDRRIMKGLRQHMAPQRPGRPLRGKGRPPRALPDDAPENPF
jgi:hypothetical protein